MTAIAARPRPLRPTVGDTILALLAGGVFAAATLSAMLLAPVMIGLPDFTEIGPVDGLWSFLAYLGPLLLAGYAFAYGVGCVLPPATGMPPLTPVALTTVVLGYVATAGVGALTVLAFIALALVARQTSGRERRPVRWTWATAGLTLLVALALSMTTVSYAVLHPLRAAHSQRGSADGNAVRYLKLHNSGTAGAVVLGARVPGAPTVQVGHWLQHGDTIVPINRARLAPHEQLHLTLSMAAPCEGMRSVDRVEVRMRVRGQEVDQSVPLAEPLEVPCAP